MDTEKKRALIEDFLDAYNHLDVERMIELVHPDIEFKNISRGEVDAIASGLKDFRALAEQSAQLFSSRRQTATKLELDNEVASVEITFTGVLAIEMPSGMKAGETLQVTGRSEFMFGDEKIYQLTDYS